MLFRDSLIHIFHFAGSIAGGIMEDREEASAEHINEVVDQLTRRKLAYSQSLLGMIGWRKSGTRKTIRKSLIKAVTEKEIGIGQLEVLLNDLDAWGDQRVRLIKFDPLPDTFDSISSVREMIKLGPLSDLLDRDSTIAPPEEMAPITISFPSASLVRLIAGKLEKPLQKISDIAPRILDRDPSIQWIPFRVVNERQISFAEIDLDTGLCLVSISRSGSRSKYDKEFDNFFDIFRPVIDFYMADEVPLFDAVRNIYNAGDKETRIYRHDGTTSKGGAVINKSMDRGADIRKDGGHIVNYKGNRGIFCNCFWTRNNTLTEEVHSLIFAPDGEISIFGQVTENNVKYVLRRIIQFNSSK